MLMQKRYCSAELESKHILDSAKFTWLFSQIIIKANTAH